MDSKIVAVIAVLLVFVSLFAMLVITEQQRYARYSEFIRCRGFLEGIGCAVTGHRNEVSLLAGGGTIAACLGLLAPLHVASFGLSAMGCVGVGALAGTGTYFVTGGTVGSLFAGILLPILVGLIFAGWFGGMAIGITKTGITFAPLGVVGFVLGFMVASWVVANWLLLLVLGGIITGVIIFLRYKFGS